MCVCSIKSSASKVGRAVCKFHYICVLFSDLCRSTSSVFKMWSGSVNRSILTFENILGMLSTESVVLLKHCIAILLSLYNKTIFPSNRSLGSGFRLL